MPSSWAVKNGFREPGHSLPTRHRVRAASTRYWLLLLSASLVKGHNHLHSFLSPAASSAYVLLGLPRFLFPGSSILSILLPSSFFHIHVQSTSRVFSPNRPNLLYLRCSHSVLFIPQGLLANHFDKCHCAKCTTSALQHRWIKALYTCS